MGRGRWRTLQYISAPAPDSTVNPATRILVLSFQVCYLECGGKVSYSDPRRLPFLGPRALLAACTYSSFGFDPSSLSFTVLVLFTAHCALLPQLNHPFFLSLFPATIWVPDARASALVVLHLRKRNQKTSTRAKPSYITHPFHF